MNMSNIILISILSPSGVDICVIYYPYYPINAVYIAYYLLSTKHVNIIYVMNNDKFHIKTVKNIIYNCFGSCGYAK